MLGLPAAVALLTFVRAILRRTTGISVSNVPGPEPESFLLGRCMPKLTEIAATHELHTGNLPEIFQSQAGVPDFKYQSKFGDVVRVKGPFGVLFLSYITSP